MRRFTAIIKLYIITALLSCGSLANAQQNDSLLLQKMDSVEISLITVDPGQEIWNLYGHTALRFHDLSDGRDLGINYGVFSFEDDGFIWHFVFGTTDYEMGTFPMNLLVEEYRIEQRGMREQVLNLTPQDKLQIFKALVENSRPENIRYRYNYFFDNCTTRARDIVELNLTGKLRFSHSEATEYPSFRKLIHRYNEDFPWARFGNDILLGCGADRAVNFREQQFLPHNLCHDLDSATYNGKPFVKRSSWLLPQSYDESGHTAKARSIGQILSPTVCFVALLLLTIAITLAEFRLKRLYWGYDLMLMLLTGLAGCVLTVMIFSEQPTVRVNFQLLLLNPLPLLMAWSAVRSWRRRQSHVLETVCLCLTILFVIAGFWQTYADGMYVLALTLLVRSQSKRFLFKRLNR